MTDLRQLKLDAARAALEAVGDDMIVGLGTGSTAEEFVKLLGSSIRRGDHKRIRAICTSKRTEQVARASGIEILDINEMSRVDVAVDGADEIDENLRLIKGRGGALLREKIIEQTAAKFIVIADDTKIVPRLGAGPLPVDVVPFAHHLLVNRFDALGLQPRIRMKDGQPFITDDQHLVIDITVPEHADIAEVVNGIYWFVGVVETGFFDEEASEAIIASPDGIRRMRRKRRS